MCTSCVSLYLAIYYVILIRGVGNGIKMVLLGISCTRLSVEFYYLLLGAGYLYLCNIGKSVGWLRKGVWCKVGNYLMWSKMGIREMDLG